MTPVAVAPKEPLNPVPVLNIIGMRGSVRVLYSLVRKNAKKTVPGANAMLNVILMNVTQVMNVSMIVTARKINNVGAMTLDINPSVAAVNRTIVRDRRA